VSWWQGAGRLPVAVGAGKSNAVFRTVKLTNMSPTNAMERKLGNLKESCIRGSGNANCCPEQSIDLTARSLLHFLNVPDQDFDFLRCQRSFERRHLVLPIDYDLREG
jgi:hypothetical protein